MRGRGGGGHGGGGGRQGGGPADDDAPARAETVTLYEFMRILYPYFWPSGTLNRLSALSCFAALALSKTCGILSPYYLGRATDELLHNVNPISSVLAYTLLRFAVSFFEEIQRLVYLRTKEVAYREIACSTFAHLHSLSLNWHVSKRSGVVLRSMDRGINSASTVVDMLFLRLVPTVIEMFALVAIFGAC